LYEPYELAIVGDVLLIVEYRLYRRPNEGYFFSSILKSNKQTIALFLNAPQLTDQLGRFSTEGLNSLPAGSRKRKGSLENQCMKIVHLFENLAKVFAFDPTKSPKSLNSICLLRRTRSHRYKVLKILRVRHIFGPSKCRKVNKKVDLSRRELNRNRPSTGHAPPTTHMLHQLQKCEKRKIDWHYK
jgi:hypothetical protein